MDVNVFISTLAAVAMLLCVCIAKKNSYIWTQNKGIIGYCSDTPQDIRWKLPGLLGSTKTLSDRLSVSGICSSQQLKVSSLILYSRTPGRKKWVPYK